MILHHNVGNYTKNIKSYNDEGIYMTVKVIE